MIKEQVAVEPRLVYSALYDFRKHLQEEHGLALDLSDGVKVNWADGWVHVRASNTESIIRIIVEAENAARAGEILDWAHGRLGRSGLGGAAFSSASREP
jgi:phosphomannomutase